MYIHSKGILTDFLYWISRVIKGIGFTLGMKEFHRQYLSLFMNLYKFYYLNLLNNESAGMNNLINAD